MDTSVQISHPAPGQSQINFIVRVIDDPEQLVGRFSPTDKESLFAYHALIIGSIEGTPIYGTNNRGLIRDFR